MAAKISYARSGDIHIAYAVVGDGPLDVVYVPGFVSSVDLGLESLDSGWGPSAGISRLARYARVVVFDKRGTGLSDRSVGVPGLETRMVLVSRTVRDLTAGSGLSFADRGEHELKGIPDRWHVFQAAS